MRKIILFVFPVFFAVLAHAQILDDTTANVYSAATTQYTTQERVQYEMNTYLPLDTAIDNLHKLDIADQSDYYLQNLGNIGTAMNPVFFTPPSIIGRTAGFTAYDPYYKTPDQYKYYDSKSPYSEVRAIFAGGNRNIVDVIYTRNINERWNVGFDFKRISSEKQLDKQSENNRQILSTYYDLFTHYRSKNNRYALMANAGRMNHEARELGGIDADPDEIPAAGEEAFYLYEDAIVLLNNAHGREYRFNVHLYHQYQLLSKNIQLFHEMDRGTEKNGYSDYSVKANRSYYDRVLINPDTTNDEFRFSEFKNRAGIKGSVGNLFYLFFAQHRQIAFDGKYLDAMDREYENSAGFHLRWQFDSLHYLRVNGELLTGGEHLLRGDYRNKFFEASYLRIMSRPSYLHETYFGNHNVWNNNFRSPNSDNLYAAIHYSRGALQIQPFFRFSSVFNHIYFNEQKEPGQTAGFAQIFSPGLKVTLNPFRAVYWETEAVFTEVAGSSRRLFRYPTWLANSSVYFKDNLFNDKLEVKLGLSAHYKSPYFALAYDPVTQNFYLQNEFRVPRIFADQRYAALQAFVNMKIGAVRLFFRMEHLNQGDGEGYFVTPYYTAQKRTLNFGVNWMFFD